jgi:uncharacterized protein (TIGR02452 family)
MNNNKTTRMTIAQHTVACVENGFYTNPNGIRLQIGAAVRLSIERTRTYSSEELEAIVERYVAPESTPCTLSVVRASSFEASAALAHAGKKVLCLNFASAKNPGGGFLGGAQAQEEALSRSSALYFCLKDQDKYYKTNRSCGTTLYTDTMIHSPLVPFFKDDDGNPLEEPVDISVITAPAVNLGAIKINEHSKLNLIGPVMLRRTEKLLVLCAHLGYKNLVLGAWGCGVFRNDPKDVAAYFDQFLGKNGKYATAFESVTFAILAGEKGSENLTAFEERFKN